jgi:hypothetical protein
MASARVPGRRARPRTIAPSEAARLLHLTLEDLEQLVAVGLLEELPAPSASGVSGAEISRESVIRYLRGRGR